MSQSNHNTGPSPNQVRLSIGQVAQHAGRSASSIRYYESIGVLPQPERIGGQRRYAPEVLRLLAVIDSAQRAGLSLEEIRDLLTASQTGTPVGDQLRALAQRKLPQLDALIHHAQTMKGWLRAASTCQCLTLEDCPLLDTSIPTDCS